MAIMHCLYDLEGDPLYAVKWYKGESEFFRYAPKEKPPIKQFKIPGLNVAEKYSNDSHVVLEDVSVENSGSYRCEITADEPIFITGTRTAYLQVIEVPKSDPYITGLKHRYKIGDTLKAECFSKDSRPAANLTWLVNGFPVEPVRIRRHRPHNPNSGHLLTAHSALRLPLTNNSFIKDRLKVRCVASMYNVYYRSSEKSVELEKPRRKHHGYSTTPWPAINWEQALPAERSPHTTCKYILRGRDNN